LKFPNTVNGNKPNGVSFHHGRFIQKLREAARKQKNVIIAEGAVSSLIYDEKDKNKVVGVSYKNPNGTMEKKTAFAPLTFLVDGCTSNLRKEVAANVKHTESWCQSKFYGLVLKTELPTPNHGHVFVMKPSPSLAYSIGTGEARALIDIPDEEGVHGNEEAREWMRKNTIPQV